MDQDTIYLIMYAIGIPILLVMLVRSLRRKVQKSPPQFRKRILPSDEWCEAARMARLTRWLAIGLLVALILECLGVASGIRFNGSPSFPEGFYFVTGKDAEQGDLVFVNIPSSPVLEMAKERGYLNVVKFQQRYQT
jgi:hypothetical protein